MDRFDYLLCKGGISDRNYTTYRNLPYTYIPGYSGYDGGFIKTGFDTNAKHLDTFGGLPDIFKAIGRAIDNDIASTYETREVTLTLKQIESLRVLLSNNRDILDIHLQHLRFS